MSCRPIQAGDVAPSMRRGSGRCLAPTTNRGLPRHLPTPPRRGWWVAADPGAGLGPAGAVHGHAGRAGLAVCGIHDPRSQEPLVLATTLPVSAYAVWRLSRDRGPIEPVPLAAKQRRVHTRRSVRWRAPPPPPALALLAGNVFSYVAATSAAVAMGFWDRCCRPTCGRVRRVLLRVDFCEIPVPAGDLRKKASVTAHLPKGGRGIGGRRVSTPSRPTTFDSEKPLELPETKVYSSSENVDVLQSCAAA